MNEWIRISRSCVPPPIAAVYAQRGTTLHEAHVRLNPTAYRVTSATGRTVVWSQKENGKWKARLV